MSKQRRLAKAMRRQRRENDSASFYERNRSMFPEIEGEEGKKRHSSLKNPLEVITIEGKTKYRGGIQVLTPDLGMKLSPIFLKEFGVERFKDLYCGNKWGMNETKEVVDFLMKNNIQPSPENTGKLTMGAMIELL